MKDFENMFNNPEKREKKAEEKDRYNPFEKEKYWQDFWEREGVYRFNPEKSGQLYTMDTPPPTISGSLHLGHIFSYTQAEVIARFKRMNGLNVRYPFGLDNNGLPTERLVEKEIGKRGQDMPRDDFVKICLETTEKYKKIYENLWRSIGLSVDWKIEYSTISPEVQKLSQTTFKELYENGIIYKKNAPALYCCECQTAFAQAEKEDKEKEAVFYDLSFTDENNKELVISTTRPELLPACVAVFVNPEDPRYKEFIGKKIKTPLGEEVTIMPDDKVEKEKGSGAVMCCTYGDETDVYWTKTYNLPEKVIINKSGKFEAVENLPEINGKSIEEAQRIIVEKLREGGFIKSEKKIEHSVGVHERCGTPVEFLPTTQWFVKVLDMKEKLLEAGNRINWYPSYMQKRYEEWVLGLKWDWCVSRERFYGIPIPVYNCDKCDEVVFPEKDEFPIDPMAKKDIQSCPNCKEGHLIPEKSVLDTWFTSSISPDVNNNSSSNGRLQNKMYPMSMRPQAHDIIRTWAFYSILMGLYKHNEIPWKDLMISGHVLVKKGEKISKKTGGGEYRPEELIASQSADAIRYAMCGAALGKDSYFERSEVDKGKKLMTKLYNAGKLVLSNLQDFDPKAELPRKSLEAADQWILYRAAETAQKMTEAFNNYEFSQARQIFEDFFWADFCDNYLEIIKGRISSKSGEEKDVKKRQSAQFSAYKSFLYILKMISPFMPHITEEMYHAEIVKKTSGESVRDVLESKFDKGFFYKSEGTKSVHNSNWPVGTDDYFDDKIIEGAKLTLQIISEVRKFKTVNKIKLSAPIASIKVGCPKKKQNILKPFLDDMASVVKSNKAEFFDSENLKVEIEL